MDKDLFKKLLFQELKTYFDHPEVSGDAKKTYFLIVFIDRPLNVKRSSIDMLISDLSRYNSLCFDFPMVSSSGVKELVSFLRLFFSDDQNQIRKEEMFEFKITIEFQKGFLYLLDKEYIFRQHSINYCTSDILPDLRDAISELSAVLYIQMPYYLLSYS